MQGNLERTMRQRTPTSGGRKKGRPAGRQTGLGGEYSGNSPQGETGKGI